MFYAINLADLSAQRQQKGEMCPVMLLFGDLLTDQTVICEGNRLDGGAVLLKDMEPERMTAILEVVHKGIGMLPAIPKNMLRIYQANSASAKTWKRI